MRYAVIQYDDGLVRRIFDKSGPAKRSITMGHYPRCFVSAISKDDEINPGDLMEAAAQYARRGRM